jgi:hypothetical protein
MSDSLKKELEAIKADTPTSVKADPVSLLYGGIFVALGVWLMDLGSEGFGLVMILVGAIGVLAGGATFVWKSPKVKVLQAIDSFLMALLFLGFMTQDGGDGIFENPLVCLGVAAFMGWSGFDDLKEYWNLSKIDANRRADSQ